MSGPTAADARASHAPLAALIRTGILDSPREAAFDRLTRLACRALDVPTAAISFVGADHVWLKSVVGMPDPIMTERRLPLSQSLCTLVVESGTPLIVDDARADSRLCRHPAVTEMGLGAFVELPLFSPSGVAIGSFCAASTEARNWTTEMLDLLRDLAATATAEVRLRSSEHDFEQRVTERTHDLETANAKLRRTLRDLSRAQTELETQNEELIAARAQVEAERARYRGLFDFAPDGYIVTNSAGEIVECNRSAARMLDAAPETLLNKRFSRYIAPPDRALLRARASELRDASANAELQLRLRPARGASFDAELRLAPYTAPGGQPAGYRCVFRDITERKQAEEALRSGEERLALALDGGNVAMWDCDLAANVVQYSDTWERLLGYPLAEIRPEAEWWRDLVHRADLPALWEQTIAHLKGDIPEYYGEHRLRTAAGEWIRVLMRGRVTSRNSSGRALRFIGTAIDITERAAHEAVLTAARDAALEAAQVKSDFLATMSHELRTPLNGVVGMTQLLLDSPLQPEQQGYARTLYDSAGVLLSLLNDILDFSKLEAGLLVLNPAPFDLHKMVRDTISLFSPQASARGLELAARFGARAPRHLIGDGGRLRQVLTNLIGNAIKFSDWGHIRVEVDGFTFPDGTARLRLSVTDTGIGIPEDKIPLIFDKFTQLDSSAARQHGGSGLGLSICKQIVTLMEGEIGASSAAGVGSTFWCTFDLPLDPAAPLQAAAPPAGEEFTAEPVVVNGLAVHADSTDLVPAADSAAAIGPPRRVLMVEDNATNRKVARTLLERLGCLVETANDGHQALAMFATRSFDVIFMDWQMPGLDGLETTRAIRSREAQHDRQSIPIVAMTANALAGDRQTCLAAGMNDYLAKPIDPAELEAALNHWAPLQRDPPPVSAKQIACLDRLAAAVGAEFVQELLDDMCRDGAERVAEMRAALAANDPGTLSRSAHSCKGMVLTLGFTAWGEGCQRLETLAREGSMAGLRMLVEEVAHHFDAALACRATWTAALPSAAQLPGAPAS